MRRDEPTLSIVVPVFNEAGNLGPLAAAIGEALGDETFELVFVDDGSGDGSLAEITALAEADGRVRYLALSRNFGQQNAIKAGLDHARGNCVVTMDADGQHPVALLHELLRCWRAGHDVVTTVRLDGRGLRPKAVGSRLFYRAFRGLSALPLRDGAADFRLLDRRVVDVCASLPERDLFWRGLMPWLGYRQAEVHYQPAERGHGSSGYSLARQLTLATSGLVAFSERPLQIGVLAGLGIACSSLLYLVYALGIRWLTDDAVPGWTSIIASVLLIGGAQLALLGVIGIYIGKILAETRQRPRYLVRASNIPEASTARG